MCGIWGLMGDWSRYSQKEVMKVIKDLFLLSEIRGKEAAGIAALQSKETIVLKRGIPADKLIKTTEFKEYMNLIFESSMEELCIEGHSRLVTNGTQMEGVNNQPVAYGNVSAVHNGIIVNVEELWKENKDLRREGVVDTEIFVKIANQYLEQERNPIKAIVNTYKMISGMASTINIIGNLKCAVAASNNGSLYYMCSQDEKMIILASEKNILINLLKKNAFLGAIFSKNEIKQITSNTGILFIVKEKKIKCFNFDSVEHYVNNVQFDNVIRYYGNCNNKNENETVQIRTKNWTKYEINLDAIKKIRRCTKCLLPETMPFIEYDSEGVCNYCKTYKKQVYKEKRELDNIVENIKKKNAGKQYDSLVSFSGGRDSSFGLHYFVKELGLRPVAYSYDWGMVTDLARRNQSRMCSQLGVELILVSADIKKKRENIRKNVSAWLKKPDLGMVPIFMAGDKQFFYYANKVCKEYMINNVLLASNPFEKTHFKSGFCGVKPAILGTDGKDMDLESLPLKSVLRMAGHYAGQYMKNPSYINSSLIDTIGATFSYYIIPHNYFRIFDYMPWDEKEVNRVLLNDYDWETATDTDSTWRIGDGTAPFYNYIYYLLCGFSENDTLRSNQIREGMITREEGLELIYRDNQPRFESMEWYFNTIGIDMEEALKTIWSIPRMYEG